MLWVICPDTLERAPLIEDHSPARPSVIWVQSPDTALEIDAMTGAINPVELSRKLITVVETASNMGVNVLTRVSRALEMVAETVSLIVVTKAVIGAKTAFTMSSTLGIQIVIPRRL